MAMSASGKVDPGREPEYYAYVDSWPARVGSGIGWLLGWIAYWMARVGLEDRADALIDDAIALRRANSGAIRAIGYLNGRRGLRAHRRGRLFIHGRTGDRGPFANQGFYATYHVAAPNKMRALALIKRFERDAIPESLEVEEGVLEFADDGAEGILSVQGGRCFYSEDP